MHKNTKKDLKGKSLSPDKERELELEMNVIGCRSHTPEKGRSIHVTDPEDVWVESPDGSPKNFKTSLNLWFEKGTEGLRLGDSVDVIIQLSLKDILICLEEGELSEVIENLVRKHLDHGALDEHYLKRIESMINNSLVEIINDPLS